MASEPRDEVPVEVRFSRLAKAAVSAASDAIGTCYTTEERTAKIHAVGRIAAALIESEARR